MLFRSTEREFAANFSRFLYLNPFFHVDAMGLRDRLLAAQMGLADAEARQSPIAGCERAWVDVLVRRAEALLARLKKRWIEGTAPENYEEQSWYEDLLIGSVYYRTFEGQKALREAGDGTQRVNTFRDFAALCQEWTSVPFEFAPFLRDPAHMFAIFVQLRRSIDLIPQLIQGNSRPMVLLRASIWNSIFPHELRLYGTLLYDRMHEVTTLILGPSGSGKELVATAIGLSRLVPFDAKRERFIEPFGGVFHPINLSAMPRDLIESEMFGHCAGSFTGAVKDRDGWFDKCSLGHTVFLDEIGELAEAVQVKLLRVLQSREFFRVGETEPRRFHGRVIAATNRDLSAEMAAGRFRQDLFFRMCSDLIRTPTLRDQLDDCPDDLPFLVRLVASKCLGERAWPEQIEWLTDLTANWIRRSPEVGLGYAWPGNFRELEQCVRSVLVRGEYHPAAFTALSSLSRGHADQAAGLRPSGGSSSASSLDLFVARVRAGELTYDEILEYYCSLISSRSANLSEAARRLGKHRATIQSRILPEIVASFQ